MCVWLCVVVMCVCVCVCVCVVVCDPRWLTDSQINKSIITHQNVSRCDVCISTSHSAQSAAGSLYWRRINFTSCIKTTRLQRNQQPSEAAMLYDERGWQIKCCFYVLTMSDYILPPVCMPSCWDYCCCRFGFHGENLLLILSWRSQNTQHELWFLRTAVISSLRTHRTSFPVQEPTFMVPELAQVLNELLNLVGWKVPAWKKVVLVRPDRLDGADFYLRCIFYILRYSDRHSPPLSSVPSLV